MTIKQLQVLISAGVFSSALLAGVAYADDSTMPAASTPAVATSTGTTTAPHKHHKSMTKNLPSHACKGQNACKGQGGCKAGANGCAGKNDCKGQGGCATDGSNKK